MCGDGMKGKMSRCLAPARRGGGAVLGAGSAAGPGRGCSEAPPSPARPRGPAQAQRSGGMAAAAAVPGPGPGPADAAAAGEEAAAAGQQGPGPARLARLPLARVKALVKADPDVTLASQEAVFVLARATVRGGPAGPGPDRCGDAARSCPGGFCFSQGPAGWLRPARTGEGSGA